MFCQVCQKDTKVYTEGSAGLATCMTCGTVLEENSMVSEISFGETGGGAAMVQGSYVGSDQGQCLTPPPLSISLTTATARARAPAGYRQKGGQESREQTILNGSSNFPFSRMS